jgi:hypothetical protein
MLYSTQQQCIGAQISDQQLVTEDGAEIWQEIEMDLI